MNIGITVDDDYVDELQRKINETIEEWNIWIKNYDKALKVYENYNKRGILDDDITPNPFFIDTLEDNKKAAEVWLPIYRGKVYHAINLSNKLSHGERMFEINTPEFDIITRICLGKRKVKYEER